MRRSLPVVLLLSLLGTASAAGQVLDDALVPSGRLRLDLNPVFTSWESRFGRTATFETGREALGEDLTTPDARTLYPGAEALRTSIESLTGAAYTPTLGETVARVNKDVTRVELGAYLGITEWLTIGAMLPWTRTRANVDLWFSPDTVGGDLGLSPVYSDATAVAGFLGALASAEASALAYATQTCAASPGSPECASAQGLADRTSSFLGSTATAYDASPFFPIAGSSTATSLSQATAALDADLVAAGLPPIGASMVFASQFVDEENFLVLPTTAESGVLAAAPLGSVRGLWQAGDVEVSATIRLLESRRREPAEPPPGFTYSVLATFLGRLPTGSVDDADILLDVGTGDGQTDLEGRLRAGFTLGQRLSLLTGARYGVQRSRTLVRRVAPPEVVLAPLPTRQLVEWTPGSYWGLEVAPGFRFARELTLSGEYRVFRKYRDEYELADASVGAPFDPWVLELESGVTLHEVGGTLRYDSVARALAGESGWPMQLQFRVLRAVAGGGGQTPVTTRAEFGVRLFRRLWGS